MREGGRKWHCSPWDCNVNSYHLKQDVQYCLWASCSSLFLSPPTDPAKAPTPPVTPLEPAPTRSSGGLAPTPIVPKRPKVPARSSSRSRGPAQGPSQPVPPVIPTPPSLYTGVGGIPIPASLVPKTKLLSAIKDKTGARYLQRSKPYSPWMPTDEDLWAAHHLLNGKEEWAVQGPTFLPAGHPRRSDGKGAKYGCDFCPKVFTNLMDGRGHTQAHHLGGKLSSPLCPCSKRFNSSSVLWDHMNLKHNANPSAIQNDPPPLTS